MARGRTFCDDPSHSLKFADLPDDTSRLLASWLLYRIDRDGVCHGEPFVVRNIVFSLIPQITVFQVEDALKAMEAVGLIKTFQKNGIQWLQWLPQYDDNGYNPGQSTYIPKSKPGYVYVIVSDGYYKIGRAKNLAKRIYQFDTQYPHAVQVVITKLVEDMIGTEAQLHRQYANKRVRGEWFELTEEDLNAIGEVLR